MSKKSLNNMINEKAIYYQGKNIETLNRNELILVVRKLMKKLNEQIDWNTTIIETTREFTEEKK